MDFRNYTNKSISQVFDELKVTQDGLSNQEAKIRLNCFGANKLVAKESTARQIFFRQFKSPFIYLLFVSTLMATFLAQWGNALMIFIFIVINTLLGFYQEFRSEETIKLLTKYLTYKTKVFRNGIEKEVLREELIPGDVVILEPGDVVPAEIRLISQDNLLLDESILTGESTPVKKTALKLLSPTKEIYQAKNIVFSGATVVSGKGKGVVIATGKQTVMGGITKLTGETVRESIFEKEITRLSQFILRLVLVTLLLILLANLFLKRGSVNPVNLIIFSIALAVSVVPEALPLVTTFSFSQGALHLAKNKVVVKRLSAIEDLGSIEVLCIDKTGTITENQLSVDQIYPEKSKALFEATLAFNDLFPNHLPKNPFDLAIWKKLINQEKVDLSQYQKIKEIPFDPERRRDTTLIKNKVNKTYQIISRGAPETLISLCKNLTINEIKSLEKMIIKKGQEGKRVIAIAQRILGREPINLEVEEKNLNFSGLISFFDPIKKTASQAIQNAEKMGLKIIVLTGDRKEVAATVAHDIRLIYDPNDVISMEEYETFDLQKKLWAIENYRVFARVSPSQKYQIIQLLQKKYQVGFLGDGINDAPALKIANIALAADKASAIAIEASDIVLLQKDLNVIVEGIREGRKIFTNTTKYIITTLASNFGNFGAVATASLLVNFLPMLPSQILLLNLLSDFPMISIATDNVDNYELREPKKTNLRSILPLIITLGFVSSLFDFVCFAFFARSLPAILQTNWFIASILTEIVFIFSIRSKFFFLKAAPPSISLLLLAIFAALITIALPFLPIGQKVFQFHGPSISHLLIIFILVGFYFLTTETVKNLYLRIYQYKDQLINS